MQDKTIIRLLEYYKTGHLTERELIDKLEQAVNSDNEIVFDSIEAA